MGPGATRPPGAGTLSVRRLDISMPIFPGMPAFPGDPAFRSDPVRRIDRGDPYNLSALSLGSHTGTHVDPPRHFVAAGAAVDRLDLGALNGPCELVSVEGPRGSLGRAELSGVPRGTERVLLRTRNSERWARRLEFFPDYDALSPDGAAFLRELGVRLVGIDSLSIESDPAGAFPVHRDLLGHGIVIVEGLLLAAAAPGPYDLSCLPLLLRDGDGGPARATVTPA
jgi:arylformamidase